MNGASGAGTTPAVRRERGARRFLVTAITAGLGAGAAWAYAYFVGCRTGTCPLTSNVWTASGFGALIGLLVGWPGPRKDARPRSGAER